MADLAPAAPAQDVPAQVDTTNGATAQAQAQKKWLLKDGDYQEEITDEKVLVDRARKAWAADRKFEEAAKLRKMLEQEISSARSGDRNSQVKSLVKILGSEEKLLEFTENFLLDKIKYNSLSEEQREAMKLREENDKYRSKEEQADTANAHEALNSEVAEALKSYEGKPTIRLVMRMAEDMLANLSQKGAKMPASEALKRAERELEKDVTEYLGRQPTDRLLKILSPEALEALRKHNVEQVLNPTGRTEFKAQKADTNRAPGKQKVSTEDYFAKLEKRYNK